MCNIDLELVKKKALDDEKHRRESNFDLELAKKAVFYLANKHKLTCEGDCGISIYSLRALLKAAGVNLTWEEKGQLW